MSIRMQMTVDSGVLHIKETGEFSVSEGERAFLETLEVLGRSKVDNVLIDGRELTGDLETLERFYLGVFAANAAREYAIRNARPFPRVAVVVQAPLLCPERFVETVATNRGMLIKVCDNLNEAGAWLGIAGTNSPTSGAGR